MDVPYPNEITKKEKIVSKWYKILILTLHFRSGGGGRVGKPGRGGAGRGGNNKRGGRGAGRGGRGGKKESGPPPSAEDLDKEMDAYMKAK